MAKENMLWTDMTKERFECGDKVTVKFPNKKQKATIVGRIWPSCWFVDVGKPHSKNYPYRVVLVLDSNVERRKK